MSPFTAPDTTRAMPLSRYGAAESPRYLWHHNGGGERYQPAGNVGSSDRHGADRCPLRSGRSRPNSKRARKSSCRLRSAEIGRTTASSASPLQPIVLKDLLDLSPLPHLFDRVVLLAGPRCEIAAEASRNRPGGQRERNRGPIGHADDDMTCDPRAGEMPLDPSRGRHDTVYSSAVMRPSGSMPAARA